MRDAEGVPEDDVGIVDGGVAVRDPLGNTTRGLARGLRNVAAGGENLVVVVWKMLVKCRRDRGEVWAYIW